MPLWWIRMHMLINGLSQKMHNIEVIEEGASHG
jgi:hypothetical protein